MPDMDSDNLREIAERDQLWASLRDLRGEIQQVASGEFDDSQRQQKLLVLLARIVAAEMDFRSKGAGGNEN